MKGVNRSFGLVLSGGCGVLALLAFHAGHTSAIGWSIAATVFLGTSLALPRGLAPLRRAWLRAGRLLSHIVTPMILGVIYVLAIVPVAMLMRLARRDAMARRLEPARGSYWIERAPDRPAAERLSQQF